MTITLPPSSGVAGAPGHQPVPVRSVGATLAEVLASDEDPDRVLTSPMPTGFDLIDRVLDGGLRAHDLLLLGGNPGVGKTIAALQFARHMARRGHRVLYISYEHDEPTMLGRLLALELGELARPDIAADLDRLATVVVEATAGFRSLEAAIRTEPLVARACREVETYADHLLLARGSGVRTDLTAIEDAVVSAAADTGGILVVDYLQKVAVHPEPADEAEKVTRVTEGLKELALEHDIAVIALVAADWHGVRAGRTRLHHLRGSSALAYECDVAVLMNDKHDAVSRVHLAYDAVRAEAYKQQVIFSIEKNRGGPSMVNLEFRKDFANYRFDPRGAYPAERFVDDRLEPV